MSKRADKSRLNSSRAVISLFSGAMGLDLGMEAAGFGTLACVENDQNAVETIRLNRPELPVFGDVREVTGKKILAATGLAPSDYPVVIGGPPCQAFSVFGNRNGVEDLRGQLVYEYIRLIDELRPHVFVMENVRGLLSMPIVPKKVGQKALDDRHLHGSLLQLILKKFAEIGYRVDCFVVNSANYGAPQIRERLVCIGNRHNLVSNFPPPQFSNRPEDGLPPFTTLGDVIGPDSGFSDPCPEVMNFSPRKLNYLSMVPEGGNWRSLPLEVQKESMGKSWFLKGGRSAYWRKLSFAFPSPTVVTMPNHAGTSMCHPSELRAITVGEAAAIQEFPSTWRFAGNTTAKFRQVGNAVPTRLGRVAGEVIEALLASIPAAPSFQPLIESQIVHVRPHVRTRTFFKKGQAFAGDFSYYEDGHTPIIPDNQLSLWSC